MDEPTEAQIKEFWEWCGWRIVEDTGRGWYSVDPLTKQRYMGTSDPICLKLLYLPIDLNNLFKYAVPKLQVLMEEKYPNGVDGRHYTFMVLCGWLSKILDGEDPANALYWAIWEGGAK